MRPRLPCARHVFGFTLLELMVALALLAGVAAFTMPRLLPSADIELRDATAKIASALRRARRHAVHQTEAVVCRFDFGAGTVPFDGAQRPWRLPRSIEYQLTTARAEASSGDRGAMRFFPDGSSTGGSVLISTVAGAQRRIDVSWLTGQIRVRSL